MEENREAFSGADNALPEESDKEKQRKPSGKGNRQKPKTRRPKKYGDQKELKS